MSIASPTAAPGAVRDPQCLSNADIRWPRKAEDQEVVSGPYLRFDSVQLIMFSKQTVLRLPPMQERKPETPLSHATPGPSCSRPMLAGSSLALSSVLRHGCVAA